MAKLSNTSKLHLFRGIVVTKMVNSCARIPKLYSPRELFLAKLHVSGLGFHPKLHSLKSEGASAVANAGVYHGCWCSESAKDGYIKDSVPALMSVSKSLKLW